jgi:hypothetical protein
MREWLDRPRNCHLLELKKYQDWRTLKYGGRHYATTPDGKDFDAILFKLLRIMRHSGNNSRMMMSGWGFRDIPQEDILSAAWNSTPQSVIDDLNSLRLSAEEITGFCTV